MFVKSNSDDLDLDITSDLAASPDITFKSSVAFTYVRVDVRPDVLASCVISSVGVE